MEIETKIKKEIHYIIILLITIITLVLIYLIALNGRYMYANMEGEDLIIDKWTKTVYMFQGKTKLKKIADPKINYIIPPVNLEEARKRQKQEQENNN